MKRLIARPPAAVDERHVLYRDIWLGNRLQLMAQARGGSDGTLVVIASDGRQLAMAANLLAQLTDVGVDQHVVLVDRVCRPACCTRFLSDAT